MTINELIKLFVSNPREVKSGSLTIEKHDGGFALYSYRTIIARRWVRAGFHHDEATKLVYMWINSSRYSVTTTKQQGRLAYECSMQDVPVVLKHQVDPVTVETFMVMHDAFQEGTLSEVSTAKVHVRMMGGR